MVREGWRYEECELVKQKLCLMPRAWCMCLHHPPIEIGVCVLSFCHIYRALFFSLSAPYIPFFLKHMV